MMRDQVQPLNDNHYVDGCPFCRRDDLRLVYAGGFHKRKKDYGPFDLYECNTCGSALTSPPPSSSRLSDFYASMTEFGMSQFARTLIAEDPGAAWHDMSV